MISGDVQTKEGNKFVGYTAAVKDHKTIRDMYAKLRLVHPGAKHIICAFYLPGQELHYNQDSHDDGDHGVSKHILQIMLQNGLVNRVIFVTRHSNGVKMGSNRFGTYLKAAASAVNKCQVNEITNMRQQVDIDPYNRRSCCQTKN